MKKKKHILLTFDHELFLGKQSGHVEHCMVEPTKYLQEVFDKHQIRKAIFFVDTTYMQALKSTGGDFLKDYDKVCENLQFLLENGHYVFPHIHPHWLDATHENGEWQLTNLNKYAFKNCSAEEQEKIWEDSFRILKEIGVEQYHSIDGFRAGGWCIQPFSDFKPYFQKHGITYDFTVMPYTYSWTDAQQYDYTAAPSATPYRFSDDVMKEDSSGAFVEIPIGIRNSTRESIGEKLWKKYLWKTGNTSLGNGIGVVPNKLSYQPHQSPKNVQMISLELMHAMNFKIHQSFLDQNEIMHFISHPKMLSRHNIKIFDKFMNYATQKFNLEFDFKHLPGL